MTIEDDYKRADDPHRLLQERWTGETWFEISTAQSSKGPQKRAPKLSTSSAVKKKAFKAIPPEEEDTAVNETTESPMPDESLQEALQLWKPMYGSKLPAARRSRWTTHGPRPEAVHVGPLQWTHG